MTKDSLLHDLDKEFAPAWKPDPGDKIAGIVTDLSEREGAFGRYPIVTLRTEDGEFAVHAFHEVLTNELARLAPKQGDVLGIKYVGKHPERGYHVYRVRRSGADAGVQWARYSTQDDDLAEAATQTALEDERDGRDAELGKRDVGRLVHEPLDDAA